MDAVYIAIGVVFFATTWILVGLFGRLQ